MSRKTINQTFCDTCNREIKQDERVYCGVKWSNQKVDTRVDPNPQDASCGDHCAECFVNHLFNYTKKMAKLHSIKLEDIPNESKTPEGDAGETT